MKPTCQAQRDLMVDYVFGELEALKAARLEAHIDNCEACRQVQARLAEGLGAARHFEPEVPQADEARRLARLTPFLEVEPRPARFERWGIFAWTIGGAAACATAVAVFLSLQPVPQADFPPPVNMAQVSVPTLPTAPLAVQHRQLTPHLKAVASSEWKGTVSSPSEHVTEVEMQQGFAVLDFEGGQRRVLRVKAPDVQVRVLGTRFFVEARDGVPTTVGVVSGRIEISSHNQVEVLGAGQVRAYDASGAYTPDRKNLRSAQHHEDTFLERAPKIEPSPAAPSPSKRASKRRAQADAVDPVVALTRAERLVRQGRVSEGLAVYELILRSRPPSAMRDLVRYEQARVWGFVQGDYARAERSLKALVQDGQGEVKRQAQLARCELSMAAERPCVARSCLDSLVSSGEGPLAQEARALMGSWGVSGATCGDHKKSEAAQPTK